MKTCKMLHRLESRIDNRLYRMVYMTPDGKVRKVNIFERSYARAKAAVQGMKDFKKLVRKTRGL